jgi:hypothetical protein
VIIGLNYRGKNCIEMPFINLHNLHLFISNRLGDIILLLKMSLFFISFEAR